MRVSVDFLDHPKIVKLERRLGFDGVKSLLRLWGWCASSRPTGEVGDAEDLEIASRWFGKAGDFATCLLDLGLLDRDGDAFRVHQWAEHNPWVAEREARSEAARKSVEARWERERARKAGHKDTVVENEKYERNTTELRPAILPTQPNPTQPNVVCQNDLSSPAPAAPTNVRPKRQQEPADDAAWIASLKADPAYRGIDVQRELAKAQSWCKQNRKQLSRRRFVNWLLRADKNLSVSPGPPQAVSADDDPLYSSFPVVRMIDGKPVRFVNGKPVES